MAESRRRNGRLAIELAAAPESPPGRWRNVRPAGPAVRRVRGRPRSDTSANFAPSVRRRPGVVDPVPPRPLVELTAIGAEARSVAFSPDGSVLAYGAKNGRIGLLDWKSRIGGGPSRGTPRIPPRPPWRRRMRGFCTRREDFWRRATGRGRSFSGNLPLVTAPPSRPMTRIFPASPSSPTGGSSQPPPSTSFQKSSKTMDLSEHVRSPSLVEHLGRYTE